MLVVAGVSALQPLLAIAGLERAGKAFVPPQAGVEDVARVVDVAAKATAGNFVGPLVAAVTMVRSSYPPMNIGTDLTTQIPILSTTSPSPSILLLSSLAAAIPAPTRSLYCATKAASYTLYRALAQEHPGVSFSFVLPSTVEGAFRASAVDDPDAVAEKDPQAHGLKREAVARRCVRAVDEGAREVFMPRLMGLTPPLYWLAPTFIEWRARVKYNFVVE
jgi:NAD(P)-dependent dehydrogenase (short-subunit alcohol dehydrogenase family)